MKDVLADIPVDDHITVRCPDVRTGDDHSQDAGDDLYSSLAGRRQNVYRLLFAEVSLNSFSTNAVVVSNSKLRNWSSLETIHDGIHGLVGQGGHMGVVATSAFDPIFWLHHWYVAA